MNVLDGLLYIGRVALGALLVMGCVPIAGDEDTERHANLINSAGIEVEDVCFSEEGTVFRLRIFSALQAGPTLLVLHDNEQTAFDTAIQAIAEQGGRLVAVENDERRNIGRVDPNRIFGERYDLFTHIVTSFLESTAPIIVLHTNRDGYGGPAGTISIKRWLNGNAIRSFDHGDDEDNLIWLAGRQRLRSDLQSTAIIDALRQRGINAVYEYVSGASDGSLSNWAALNGWTYFNLEVEEGQLQRQQELLAALRAILQSVQTD